MTKQIVTDANHSCCHRC